MRERFGYGSASDFVFRGFHSGIDIGRQADVPVQAGAKGRVVAGEERNKYGIMIEIDHGRGFRTRYGHLHSVTVKPGDIVSRGQVIGKVGSTGETRTPTLHFEVWLNNVVRDPTKYFESETACTP